MLWRLEGCYEKQERWVGNGSEIEERRAGCKKMLGWIMILSCRSPGRRLFWALPRRPLKLALQGL